MTGIRILVDHWEGDLDWIWGQYLFIPGIDNPRIVTIRPQRRYL